MDRQQLNPRNLLPKERLHIIKHYIGHRASILNPGNYDCLDQGVIEEVNINEADVVLKNDGIHRHVDVENVAPRLKKFKSIELEDIHELLDIIVLNNVCPERENFYVDRKDEGFVKVVRDKTNGNPKVAIVIKKNWSIEAMVDGELAEVCNYPEVVFKLCELGFDVTNHF